jgi:hypothetical protein
MSQNNILHSFTLTPGSSKVIQGIPKKQKSRFVSNAILKYADNEPLNPRGQAHYMEEIRKCHDVIGKLNEHIIQLEARWSLDPPLEALSHTKKKALLTKSGFLCWLRRRMRARQSKR